MSDDSTREIQLSGKQLIFLFMSGIVLLVVVFLLGVSVGRGVNSGAMAAGGPATPASSAPDAVADAPAAGDTKVDLNYPADLSGRAGRATAPQPAPSDEVPPIVPPAAATSQPPVTESVATPPDPPAAPPQTTPPAPAPSQPPAAALTSGWFVQVGAFRNRTSADGVVSDLAGRGHKAFVSPSGGLNRVRVGPFADRAAADRAAAEIVRAGHSDARVVREGQ